MESEKLNKKIGIFTNNDDDIYCFRKELIEAFIDNGYDVLISCPYGEKFELMKDIEYTYDDPYIDRRGTDIVSDIKLFLHYFTLLRKEKPDIVLTYTAKPNVYCTLAAFLQRIPVIANVTGFGSVLEKQGILQKFIMKLFKFSYRRASCIMFQNSTNMKLAQDNGMVKGDCKLIPGSGVNTERYPLIDYPDDSGGIVFNYIGRILHDKGVDDYIECAKRITAKYPSVRFNMLGFIEPTEMHYKEDLEKLEKDGVVYYLGSKNDVRPFIASSHATIHPSTYGEGMSNVLLESASSGRPVISTDNPGCRETFIDNKTGLLYHGGDVDALCRKVEFFINMSNDERREMGIKGREYIKGNFSRDIVIKAYLEKINLYLKG